MRNFNYPDICFPDTATETTITLIKFNSSAFSELVLSDVLDLSAHLPDTESVVWIDIVGQKDEQLLRDLRRTLNIHPLSMTYVDTPTQSPRFEIYDNYQLLVSNSLTLKEDRVYIRPVSLLMGENVIVSIQNGEDMFADIKTRLRSGDMREQGMDYLAFTLIESLVCSYYPVVNALGQQMENIEECVIAGKKLGNNTGVKIHRLGRRFLFIYQNVWNNQEALDDFIRDSELVNGTQHSHFLRKCYDYTKELLEITDIYRDMNANLMNVYLSCVNNRLSEIMRILSIIVAIFAPTTTITGIWGMNFEYLVGLHSWWGPVLSFGLMAGSACGLLWLFKKLGLLRKD